MCLLIQKASDPVISNNQGQGRWLHGKATNHTGLTAQVVPGSYIKSRMWWSESVILTFYWEAEARVSPEACLPARQLARNTQKQITRESLLQWGGKSQWLRQIAFWPPHAMACDALPINKYLEKANKKLPTHVTMGEALSHQLENKSKWLADSIYMTLTQETELLYGIRNQDYSFYRWAPSLALFPLFTLRQGLITSSLNCSAWPWTHSVVHGSSEFMIVPPLSPK